MWAAGFPKVYGLLQWCIARTEECTPLGVCGAVLSLLLDTWEEGKFTLGMKGPVM